MEERKIPKSGGMGQAIGLCGAAGVVLGALFGNVTLWLLIGAGAGVIIGAMLSANAGEKRS